MSIPYQAEFFGVSPQQSPSTPQSRSTSEEYSMPMQDMTVNMDMGGATHTINSLGYPKVETTLPKVDVDMSQLRVTARGCRSDIPLTFIPLNSMSTTNNGTTPRPGSEREKEKEKDKNKKMSSESKKDLDFSVDASSARTTTCSKAKGPSTTATLQSTVQVVFIGGPQSGKSALVKNLHWGRGTRRFESGMAPICTPGYKEDGRGYNVLDLSLNEKLDVIPKMFLASESLVILVWNMGANNPNTFHVKNGSDTSDEAKKKKRKAIRALDRDIDDTVQSWIDQIQEITPGVTILLVTTFDDLFDSAEADRRCLALRKRLEKNEIMRSKASSAYVKPNLYPRKGSAIRRISNTRLVGLVELMNEITHISDNLRDRNGLYLCKQREVPRTAHLQTFIKKADNVVKRYALNNVKKVIGVSELVDVDNKDKSDQADDLIKTAATYLSAVGNVRYYGNNCIPMDSQANNMGNQLDSHVIINHTLLIEAATCVLQHDNFIRFQNEIEEAKIDLGEDDVTEGLSILAEHCSACQIPVVTHDEASLLWRISDSISEYTDTPNLNLPAFFHQLMVRYGAFVPIKNKQNGKNLYLLPSLLDNDGPCDTWTYKCGESWKTTLCYSWLFPEAVPSDFMESIIIAIAQETIPLITSNDMEDDNSSNSNSHLRVREILCGKTSIYLKLGSKTEMKRENIMEILIHLAEQDSPLCVASSTMLIGNRRLIASAKGPVGAEGRMIWSGGFELIINTIDKVLSTFVGLKTDKEIVCPECLASHKPVSQASVWKWDAVNSAASRDQEELRCRNAHPVKIPLISGQFKQMQYNYDFSHASYESCTPVSKLLGGVVLVGLLDKTSGRILRAGSGFVVDTNRGLIVTASHTLIDMDNHTPDGKPNSNFGEWYYGLEDAEVVIGVIPQSEDGESKTAVYRYFAKLLMADVRNVDACVLWITKKLEKDLEIDGEIGDDHAVEDVRYKPQGYFEKEGLTKLATISTCEYEERVRVIGYNQGGEGLLERGAHVNRTADFSVGYVCKKFQCPQGENDDEDNFFRPREEIVVIRCPTIGGHSGGPCVNQVGKVIGILSRSDPAEAHRCYIAPASEWSELVRMAKGRVKFVRRLQNFL